MGLVITCYVTYSTQKRCQLADIIDRNIHAKAFHIIFVILFSRRKEKHSRGITDENEKEKERERVSGLVVNK